MVYRDIEDRSILVAGVHGHVMGLDRQTGEVRWDNPLEGGGMGKVFLHLIGDHVLASAEGRDLYCLRYMTGELLWKGTTSGSGPATILVDQDVILVGKGGYIDAFSVKGAPLWRQPLKGRGIAAIALALPGNVQQSDSG
jgi:outer membrane protein assembly factor BamB